MRTKNTHYHYNLASVAAVVSFLLITSAGSNPIPVEGGQEGANSPVHRSQDPSPSTRDGEEEFSRTGEGPLEVVETRGGKLYRGYVIGYETETKSYLLLVKNQQVAVPEAEILTIRSPAETDPVTEATQSGNEPETETVLIEKESPSSQETEEVTLQYLTREYRKLPSPRTVQALQALEEAAERLRSDAPLSAVEPLRRAAQAEPESPAATILLAAVLLDVEKDPEAAYPLLLIARARTSGSPILSALLARVSGALGYRKLQDHWKEEEIKGNFQGAECQYRLFQYYRSRDPDQAKGAWLEYRRLDPDWEQFETQESQAMRKAQLALQRDDATGAAEILSKMSAENPLFASEAKPLLAKAFLSRAERALSRLHYEIAHCDFQALLEEIPERREEFLKLQKDLEVAWVKAKLQEASTAREVEESILLLSHSIPDFKERFGAEVGTTFCRIAENTLLQEGFDEAVEALKKGSHYGMMASPKLLDQLAMAVTGDMAAGELDQARERLSALSHLFEKDEDIRSRLDSIRSELSEAFRAISTEKLTRGNRTAARENLKIALALDPSNQEASRELARLGDPGVEKEFGFSDPEFTPYFPLTTGSRWSYRYGDGSEEVQRLVAAESLRSGQTIYRFTSELQMGDAKIPYRKTGYFADGFYYLGLSSRARGGDPILKVPVVCGDRWTWRKGDIVCEREYVAERVRVVCKAGSFPDCLKVKATSRFESVDAKSRPVVQWFYYAKEVGLVKIDGETPFDGRELLEYRIGSEPEISPSNVANTLEAFQIFPEESLSGKNPEKPTPSPIPPIDLEHADRPGTDGPFPVLEAPEEHSRLPSIGGGVGGQPPEEFQKTE